LVVAAIVGWGIGSYIGNMGSAAPAPTPSLAASPTPSAIASPSPTPIALLTPSGTPPELESEPPPPPATVLQVSGSGDKVSSTFEVRPGWQIVWRTDGPRFSIAVRGDRDFGTVVDQAGASSGAIALPSSGMLHLEVTAKGPWSIKVLQGQG